MKTLITLLLIILFCVTLPDKRLVKLQYDPSMSLPTPSPLFTFPQNPTRQSIVKPIINGASAEKWTFIVKHLSENYENGRLCQTQNGKQAAIWIKDQYQAIINKLPEERKKYFSVELVEMPNYLQPNVVARFKGRSLNEKLSKELVILGAHEDSLSRQGNAPGADDDVSNFSF